MALNLGFLASHNGSNMQAVIDACRAGRLDADPAVVISNNGDSGALERARNENIPWFHLSGRTHPEPEDLDREIVDNLLNHDVNLVILAGYMKKIGPVTLATFPGHIINIHPGPACRSSEARVCTAGACTKPCLRRAPGRPA